LGQKFKMTAANNIIIIIIIGIGIGIGIGMTASE
jgi:hypothetical protein